MRKTAKIVNIVENANRVLANCSAAERPVVCHLLESILHDAGAYQGFRFIDANDSDSDSPGYWNRRYYGGAS